MRKHLSLVLAVCVHAAGVAYARPVNLPDYKVMTAQADLVVIATPTANADLPGETTIPGVIQQDLEGKKRMIPAIRVETTFRAVAVMKGKLTGENFKLPLRFVNAADSSGTNVPMLVTFDPKEGFQYLLFLKLGADGVYEPFNGQTDPAFSVEKLQQRVPGT